MIKASISILTAMLLFAGSLLPQGEWIDLYKLPALINHFEVHKAENPSISFLDFLKMHYNDSNHHEEDPHTHHNLPLSHHNHNHPSCFHSLAFTIPPVHIFSSLIPLREIVAIEYKEPTTSSFQASIWQPPRNSKI